MASVVRTLLVTSGGADTGVEWLGQWEGLDAHVSLVCSGSVDGGIVEELGSSPARDGLRCCGVGAEMVRMAVRGKDRHDLLGTGMNNLEFACNLSHVGRVVDSDQCAVESTLDAGERWGEWAGSFIGVDRGITFIDYIY